MAMAQTTQVEIGGRVLALEAGRVAKQADGSVTVRYGESVVLATVVASKTAVEGQDFFPLTVDYRERAYAGGRIPGGFFKREGRPVEKEILPSRLIDRPLRPLFPKGFKNEIQLIVLAISADQDNDPDILAMNGASAAVPVAWRRPPPTAAGAPGPRSTSTRSSGRRSGGWSSTAASGSTGGSRGRPGRSPPRVRSSPRRTPVAACAAAG